MNGLKVQTGFTGASNNRLIADEHQPCETAHGNPVVLLHGGGQTRHAWGGAARRIADAGHVAYTVDQRGHGESAWVEDRGYAFDDYAADADAFNDAVLGFLDRLEGRG